MDNRKKEIVLKYLTRYKKEGVNHITIRKLRDNIQWTTEFKGTKNIHSTIKDIVKNDLVPIGVCDLGGTTIFLSDEDEV